MRRCERERVNLLRSPCGAVWHLTATKSSYFHSLSCGDFVASHSHHSHQTSAHSTYCLAFSCANFGVKHFKIFMIPPKVSVYIWIAYALRKWKCCKFFSLHSQQFLYPFVLVCFSLFLLQVLLACILVLLWSLLVSPFDCWFFFLPISLPTQHFLWR